MRIFRLTQPIYTLSHYFWGNDYIQLEPGNIVCYLESKIIGGAVCHTLLTKYGFVYSWFNIDNAGLFAEL